MHFYPYFRFRAWMLGTEVKFDVYYYPVCICYDLYTRDLCSIPESVYVYRLCSLCDYIYFHLNLNQFIRPSGRDPRDHWTPSMFQCYAPM